MEPVRVATLEMLDSIGTQMSSPTGVADDTFAQPVDPIPNGGADTIEPDITLELDPGEGLCVMCDESFEDSTGSSIGWVFNQTSGHFGIFKIFLTLEVSVVPGSAFETWETLRT